MEVSSHIIKTALFLINSQSFETTPRIMQVPVEVYDPSTILVEYGVPQNLLTIYGEDVQLSWQKHRPKQLKANRESIAQDSIAGQIVSYADNQARDFESRLKQYAQESYQENIDEVYQSAVRQLYSTSQLLWGFIAPHFKDMFEQGKLNALIDGENYYLAQTFCEVKHQELVAKTDALRLFLLKAPENTTTCMVKKHIRKELDKLTPRLMWWQTCLSDLQRFNHLYHNLFSFQQLYSTLWQASEDDFTENSRLFARYVEFDQALLELKAAFYNHWIMQTPRSWVRSRLQGGLNTLLDVVISNSSTIQQPRTLEAIFPEFEDKIITEYQYLEANQIQVEELDLLVNQYIDAILKNNFVLACYLANSASFPKQVFDWFEQADELEKYKEMSECLIASQERCDEVSYHLQSLLSSLFPQFLRQEIKAQGYGDAQILIKQLREYSQKLDGVRSELRNGFVKEVKETYVTHTKAYTERLIESGRHKLLRWLTEKAFFDDTKLYKDCIEDYKAVRKELENLMEKVSIYFYNIKAGAKIDVSLFSPFFEITLKQPIPVPSRHYPLFQTLSEFYKFILKHDFEERDTLAIMKYNCQKYQRLSIQWQDEASMLQSYNNLLSSYKQYTEEISLVLQKLQYLETVERGVSFVLNNLKVDQKTCAHCIVILPQEYRKYIYTSFNKLNPLTATRITQSFIRKSVRVINEGVITDQVLPLDMSLKTHFEMLDKIKLALGQGRRFIENPPKQMSLPKRDVLDYMDIAEFLPEGKLPRSLKRPIMPAISQPIQMPGVKAVEPVEALTSGSAPERMQIHVIDNYVPKDSTKYY